MNISQQFAKTGDVPLFATAKEIIEGTLLGDAPRMNYEEHRDDLRFPYVDYRAEKQPAKEAVMEQKLREAGDDAREYYPSRGLENKITQHGYDWSNPVEVSLDRNHPDGPQIMLLNGHHRVAVMAKHFPDHQIPLHVVNP